MWKISNSYGIWDTFPRILFHIHKNIWLLRIIIISIPKNKREKDIWMIIKCIKYSFMNTWKQRTDINLQYYSHTISHHIPLCCSHTKTPYLYTLSSSQRAVLCLINCWHPFIFPINGYRSKEALNIFIIYYWWICADRLMIKWLKKIIIPCLECTTYVCVCLLKYVWWNDDDDARFLIVTRMCEWILEKLIRKI